MNALVKLGTLLLLSTLALAAPVARANLWVVSLTAEAYLAGDSGDSDWMTAYFYFDPQTLVINPFTGAIEGPDVATNGIRTVLGGTVLHDSPLALPSVFSDPHAFTVESWTGPWLGTIRGFANGRVWTCIDGADCGLQGRVAVSRVPEPATLALLALGAAIAAVARRRLRGNAPSLATSAARRCAGTA